jgi:hypothetical protein
MTRRRSPIALLCAMIALLAVPAIAPADDFLDPGLGAFAAAQALGCADADPPVPSGDPDVTAPDNTTPTPNAGWYTTPYAVALSGTDAESGVDRIEWCVDGGSVNASVNGAPFTLASSGVYTLDTRVVDIAGNMSDWRQDTIQIDLAAPTDTTDPGTTAWRLTATSVTVTASDSVSGLDHVEYQLDGGIVHSVASGTVVPIAADGSHALRTRAVDVAGNISVWRDHVVRVDTVNPTDETAAPSGWQTAALPVTIAGADDHSGIAQVIYKLDGGAETTVPSGTVVTISANGIHTLETKVVDNAGRNSGWTPHIVRIDTTAPDNQTDLAPLTGWRGDNYTVLIRGADGGSGIDHVEWRVNGGAISTGTSGVLQATISANGANLFETRVWDTAGNNSGWRAETIRIDKVAPTNTTTAPAGPVANPYNVSITGSDADSGIDHVEWQVDAGDVESGDSPSPVSITGDGAHQLRSRVVDAAGNASAWRVDDIDIDITLNNDTTAPLDSTTTVPAGWSPTAQPVTVRVTDAESGMDVIQWRIAGESIQTRSGSTFALQFDEEGEYRLETRGRNLAGLWSAWRTQMVRIDFGVPTDTTAFPAGWSTSHTFAPSGDDELSGAETFEYSIDGAPYVTAPIANPVDFGGDGEFIIEHRVLDKAGQSSDWHTDTVRIDATAPANTSAVPASTWRSTALSLALSGTDVTSGLDKMQWRLNGGETHDGGPAVVDPDGEFVLETRAVDVAGNTSAWRSDTVRVDVTAPANDTPAAPAGWRSTPYSVHVEGSDTGSGVDTIERKIDGGAVSTDPDVTISGDGVHTLETRVVDLVGHASDWRSETISIDSAAPATAALTCPAGWSRGVAYCTATATDALSGIASLTASRDGGAYAAVTGGRVPVTTDGSHTIVLKASDAAGNLKTATAHVKVDRTLPAAALTCAAASTPTGYTCRASGSDATSGLSSLTYSLNGRAFAAVPAGGAFAVASGTVVVRALDAAGNQTLTRTLTLPVRTKPVVQDPVTMRTATVAVYVGKHDPDNMVGGMRAARSANGTVSADTGPLAVGRGRFRVEIVIKSGKRSRKIKKTYKVGRDGTLPRVAGSLSGATGKTTVTVTVGKRVGGKWRRLANGKAVLAK